MASVTATITVNFTSNYAGPHRVCWRTGASGPYDCTTTVVCTGGGNPCSAVIVTTVDNETCDEVNFNGYTQAACESESSTSGRDPFSVTFTPNPTCKSYTITCDDVGVDSITIDEQGSGYDPMTPPVVTITGGGGTGATAEATVGDGGIVTVATVSSGTGYVDGTYTAVPAITVTGVGSGATFDIFVSGGFIAGLDINTPGSDYAIGDNIEFDNMDLGGSGSGASYNVATENTGLVIDITVTDPGMNYSSVPTVSIEAPTGSPGVQAEATAVMEVCGDYVMPDGCDSNPSIPLTGLQITQSINVCSPTTLSDQSPTQGYTVTDGDCCYDCVYLTITKGLKDGNATVYYTSCTDRVLTQLSIGNSYSGSFCVVNNSWVVIEEEEGNATTLVINSTCP